MTWHQRLNSCIEERGWSKAEISKRSGVPYNNMLKYCGGKVSQPRGPVIDQLADALGIDPLWLLTGEVRAADSSGPAATPDSPHYQQIAFNLAVKIADQWEVELFGEANIVAHTTLVTHLYHYIIKHNIKTEDEVNSSEAFA